MICGHKRESGASKGGREAWKGVSDPAQSTKAAADKCGVFAAALLHSPISPSHFHHLSPSRSHGPVVFQLCLPRFYDCPLRL